MKMFKFMAAATILAGGVALTGCNDLEQAPSNQYTDNNFWTEKNADKMVMTAYTQLYSAGTMWGDEELADNLYSGYRAEDRHLLRRGIATQGLGLFGWNGWWGGIRSSHTFLQNKDRIEGMDEALKDRLTAEASILRDHIYFRLALLYGDLPFFMENPTLDHASTLHRTPYKEVISTITADLEEYMHFLPTKDELPSSSVVV